VSNPAHQETTMDFKTATALAKKIAAEKQCYVRVVRQLDGTFKVVR
jgi:hypothetical protein